MPIAESLIWERWAKNPESSEGLVIHPLLLGSQIQGAKIDLRLDNVFYSMKHYEKAVYNPMEYAGLEADPPDYRSFHIIPYGSSFVLQPQEFIMAPLLEFIKMPDDMAGRLDGRSSLGRLGVLVHSTAGSVDPGYAGPIMMELCNLGKFPVELFPLMRIATLTLSRIEGEIKTSYRERTKKKYGTRKDMLGAPSQLHNDDDLLIIKLYPDYEL